jgi:lipopolysaccharide/colanic/teichoic acid biosynthesis glycosyltransferase
VKTEYDLWYVKNRNILLDLRIILQTLEAVLWRRGAK